MTLISTDISKAVALLDQEKNVAIPTETVYGLAGNIYSEKAIKGIFELKKRPLFNPLIVHIHSMKQLDELAKHIPDKAKVLANNFWPGALTIILPKKATVPDLVTGGKHTVAIRMPDHPVILSLLSALNYPLAAPSANPFGAISPTNAVHVAHYFSDSLPMVLDGGACTKGIESTIIGFENNHPVLYRLGAISVEAIEKVIGKISLKNKNETNPEAPGMLAKHYAPATTTFLKSNIEAFLQQHTGKSIGVVVFQNRIESPAIKHQEILSQEGHLEEAASNLYAALHRLDSMNLDFIVAEKLPDTGLGKSINDRLERATKR
ncbi:L-threonylcarbamoyladenylate synthase [Flavobacterium sp.]|uniref:L-threonylcarbamoyladenylate synthase n=1 Tax=Flavobacterium sp. TaxID=239 RepID=UPI0026250EB7|nr:L-threonylcarbamoyladenylate synthase [Flavobacterium sp.]